MTTPTCRRWVLFILSVLLIASVPAQGSAQKKKKDSTAPTEQRTSAHAIPSMRELLLSLQGQQTNLGLLAKVAGDYVVFESETDTLMFPLGALQSVRFTKAGEDEPRKIEIRFQAKD